MSEKHINAIMYLSLLGLFIAYGINQESLHTFIHNYIDWFSLLFVIAGVTIVYLLFQLLLQKKLGVFRFETRIQQAVKADSNSDNKASSLTSNLDEEHKKKTEFLVNLSHDLCAPVYAILGYADLLFKTDLTEKQKNYVGAIKNTSGFVIDLAREISLYRTLDKDDVDINLQKFTIGTVVDDVMEVMGRKAAIKNIDLIFVYTGMHDTECVSDPFRIRQILLNLVGNAVKFTEKGCVKINVDIITNKKTGSQLYFEVIDTGIGISENDHDKIFAPFCQLNYEHSENIKQSGSGLGLAINMKLVSAMGGKLGVESRHGEGSKFWVKLPCEVIQQNENTKNLTSSSITRKALVIEENNYISDSLGKNLEYFGFESDVAKSVKDIRTLLLRAAESGLEYDVIFIASKIEKESGLDIARNIRGILKYNATPLVITVPITEQLAVGVVSSIQPAICLDKPVIPYKFKDMITDVLDLIECKNSDSISCKNNKLFSLPKASGNKILIVDDNPVNRSLLLEMFKEIHITAFAVNDGEDALKKLSVNNMLRYDIVLLDCILPGIDGYTISKQIRMLNLDRQPVIIMTSADTSTQNKLRCYKAGADEFMEKPIMMNGLINFLETWFPEKKQLDYKNSQTLSDKTVVNIFDAPILEDSVVEMIKNNDSGKVEFINHMYSLFIEDTSERIETIISCMKNQQYSEISKSAHSIKSGCLQFGARGMSIYCEVLGNMAKKQDHQQIESTLEKLIEEYRRVMDKFESYQKKSKTKN